MLASAFFFPKEKSIFHSQGSIENKCDFYLAVRYGVNTKSNASVLPSPSEGHTLFCNAKLDVPEGLLLLVYFSSILETLRKTPQP
jgi:hypothetical protein